MIVSQGAAPPKSKKSSARTRAASASRTTREKEPSSSSAAASSKRHRDRDRDRDRDRERDREKEKDQKDKDREKDKDKERHPKAIGHYVLGKTIGEGTFGKVKLGTHILTGMKVAIKVLEKHRIVQSSDVDRVAREIHILKSIHHPHVIQLYEIIETSKQLYLIMEHASHGELFDYIVARGRLKESAGCTFFQQIVSGVQELHRHGVVHRDLKPENLLLDSDKNIKIVDFGLSNTFQPAQFLETACGVLELWQSKLCKFGSQTARCKFESCSAAAVLPLFAIYFVVSFQL